MNSTPEALAKDSKSLWCANSRDRTPHHKVATLKTIMMIPATKWRTQTNRPRPTTQTTMAQLPNGDFYFSGSGKKTSIEIAL
jgi:hypothetical protein